MPIKTTFVHRSNSRLRATCVILRLHLEVPGVLCSRVGMGTDGRFYFPMNHWFVFPRSDTTGSCKEKEAWCRIQTNANSGEMVNMTQRGGQL